MSAGEQARARLRADLDHARAWLAELSSGPGEYQRGHRARWRDRRWAMRAIRSSLQPVPVSAGPEDADARLCRVLVGCINECRQLAGESAVDPLLSLADCPRSLVVEAHVTWAPGCDWMEVGYQLAPTPLPVGRKPAFATQRTPPRKAGSATASLS
jgi:hypothetical protein